jgi:hypothetical protein
MLTFLFHISLFAYKKFTELLKEEIWKGLKWLTAVEYEAE